MLPERLSWLRFKKWRRSNRQSESDRDDRDDQDDAPEGAGQAAAAGDDRQQLDQHERLIRGEIGAKSNCISASNANSHKKGKGKSKSKLRLKNQGGESRRQEPASCTIKSASSSSSSSKGILKVSGLSGFGRQEQEVLARPPARAPPRACCGRGEGACRDAVPWPRCSRERDARNCCCDDKEEEQEEQPSSSRLASSARTSEASGTRARCLCEPSQAASACRPKKKVSYSSSGPATATATNQAGRHDRGHGAPETSAGMSKIGEQVDENKDDRPDYDCTGNIFRAGTGAGADAGPRECRQLSTSCGREVEKKRSLLVNVVLVRGAGGDEAADGGDEGERAGQQQRRRRGPVASGADPAAASSCSSASRDDTGRGGGGGKHHSRPAAAAGLSMRRAISAFIRRALSPAPSGPRAPSAAQNEARAGERDEREKEREETGHGRQAAHEHKRADRGAQIVHSNRTFKQKKGDYGGLPPPRVGACTNESASMCNKETGSANEQRGPNLPPGAGADVPSGRPEQQRQQTSSSRQHSTTKVPEIQEGKVVVDSKEAAGVVVVVAGAACCSSSSAPAQNGPRVTMQRSQGERQLRNNSNSNNNNNAIMSNLKRSQEEEREGEREREAREETVRANQNKIQSQSQSQFDEIDGAPAPLFAKQHQAPEELGPGGSSDRRCHSSAAISSSENNSSQAPSFMANKQKQPGQVNCQVAGMATNQNEGNSTSNEDAGQIQPQQQERNTNDSETAPEISLPSPAPKGDDNLPASTGVDNLDHTSIASSNNNNNNNANVKNNNDRKYNRKICQCKEFQQQHRNQEAKRSSKSRRKAAAIAHWPLGKQTISHLAPSKKHNYCTAFRKENMIQIHYKENENHANSNQLSQECDPYQSAASIEQEKPFTAQASNDSLQHEQNAIDFCSSSIRDNANQAENKDMPQDSVELECCCGAQATLCARKQQQQQRTRRSNSSGDKLTFGDAEDILSPHLAAYTNFYDNYTVLDEYYDEMMNHQQSADFLSLKSGQFHKHKRPFGRQYEWPTASWIHNSTKPEWINLDCPKIPPSFKATILAASKLRRGSYDDQRGDNDINIILAPSDLQNIEKQRNRFTKDCLSARPFKIKRSLSTQISSSPILSASNKNNNNIYTLTKTKALLFEQQDLLFLNKNINNKLNKNISTSGQKLLNNNNQLGEDDIYIKNKNNISLGQLQLAKALLDQDYSLSVQLFIKKSALNWNFNSFTFDAICCGRSLTELLLHLFDYYNLYNRFKLDITNVLKCFRLLEFGYHGSNPYHNSVHAADVTQAMHCFIQEKRIRKYMTDLEILSCIMAAVCHDLDHPGVNQTFLINTKNPLANLYNSESVLENHHWRFALCIFKESNIFDHFQPDVYNQMSEQLKLLILATDIARQNEYLRRFREALNQIKRTTTSDQDQDHVYEHRSHNNNTKGFSLKDPESRSLVLQIALKCADLGNPCRPWLISRVWSNLICDELFEMGRVERILGLPLTPICQQEKTSIATIQTDFFRFIVLPLLELWHQFLQSPLSKLLMSNFEHNYQRWQRANHIVQQLKRRKSVASLERIHNSNTDNAQIISLIVMKFYKAK